MVQSFRTGFDQKLYIAILMSYAQVPNVYMYAWVKNCRIGSHKRTRQPNVYMQ